MATVNLYGKHFNQWKIEDKNVIKLSKDAKQPIAVISNFGQTGLGKTSLQNFFLCYLIKGKDSFLPEQPIVRAFPGSDLNTRKDKFVDLYSKPIVKDDVFYSVIDLEGDPVNKEPDEASFIRLFGITAAISSVIIFSIKADNTCPFAVTTFYKFILPKPSVIPFFSH
uniref:uncharacterized protein LOC108949897 n=1 Tax=Ciona intestinalis TaxID=7719 RepID=UPI00089DD4B9|nr:uncharacterized protein LOC108949897 [Ciona intestinalis]|eukprot:XP_018669450.1 uncharacterized protein LOC108949897 [Ciona intestinalis]